MLRAEASIEMREAAQPLEGRFGIRFESFTVFPGATLQELHRYESEDMSDRVTVVSQSDPSILHEIEILTAVANKKNAGRSEREAYFDALKRIYHHLPQPAPEHLADATKLFVGIEREGRILADASGCLPLGHSLCPHTKRVPLEQGLEIGVTGIPTLPPYSGCVIIDGAIASGATLIAVINKLRSATSSFEIRSAHATWEGLRGIVGYCASEGIDIRILVGHATSGLNDHYYAVQQDDPSTLVVGDLGDTISDLTDPRSERRGS